MPFAGNATAHPPLADCLIGYAKLTRGGGNGIPVFLMIHNAAIIGQIVPCVKDKMSKAVCAPLGQNEAMPEEANGELRFNNEFCARVKRLRTERGLTAAQMATALGVPAERYRKYESRSPLPAYLMAQFCLIVDCDLDHLIAGGRRHRHR